MLVSNEKNREKEETYAELRGFGSGADTLIPAAHVGSSRFAVGADFAKFGGITIVGVDAYTGGTSLESNVVDDDMTFVLGGTVAACTVELG